MKLYFFDEVLKEKLVDKYNSALLMHYSSLGEFNITCYIGPDKLYLFYMDHQLIMQSIDFNPCKVYSHINFLCGPEGYFKGQEFTKQAVIFLKHFKDQYDKYSIFE